MAGCKVSTSILLLSLAIMSGNFNPVESDDVIRATTEITPTQYHIQTDEGKNRFFKYETWAGQFRKETRLEDGTVVGSYGWVDANRILRIYDYMADDKGYRLVKKRKFKVGEKKDASSSPGTTQPTTVAADEISVIPTQAGPLQVPFSHVRELRTKKVLINRNRARVPTPPAAPYTPIDNFITDDENERLQRRVSHGNGVTLVRVQPLFEFPETDESLNLEEKRERKREQEAQIQPGIVQKHPTPPSFTPRGEGSRLRYTPPADVTENFTPPADVTENLIVDPTSRRRSQKSLERRVKVGKTSSGRRRRLRVVKRRRNPDTLLQRGRGKIGLDYQTEKFYHREKVAEGGNGDERVGEYGYIDPLGVRRVVTYTTGSRNGLTKEKENDFVGVGTYFEAN